MFPIIISNNITWNLPIKYWVEISGFASEIQKFLKKIEERTCITFEQQSTYIMKTQGLLFLKNEERTFSEHIGPSGISQPNNIHVKYIWDMKDDPGLIESAIFNALGAGPENQRCDRDGYLILHEDRAKEEFKGDFNYNNYSCSFIKNNVSYDYGSLTHDTVWHKEKDSNIGPIFEAREFKNLYQKMMGHKEHAVFSDYKKLNYIHCSDKCKNSSTKCYHGGYPNPKDCNVCICPHGYLGEFCEEHVYLTKQVNSWRYSTYGVQPLHATNEKQEWYSNLAVIFYLFIQAPDDKKIHVVHKSSRSCFWGKEYCFDERGHEIRYRADKGVMGICLCDAVDWEFDIYSEDNEMAIFYRGDCSHQFMHLHYQIHNENSNI
uniref:Astacin domain-containing protein n=1 Tax=Parastrongyloides trichosuri TaxID=131310 RepID=A0A0N5A0V4_PARTI